MCIPATVMEAAAAGVDVVDAALSSLSGLTAQPNLNSLAAVRDGWLEIMDDVKKNRPDAHVNGIAIEPMIQKPNGRELVVGMMRDHWSITLIHVSNTL